VVKDESAILKRVETEGRVRLASVADGAPCLQIEKLIVQLRRELPNWGAPRIREKLRRLNLGISLPAISTVHAVIDRHGLVKHDARRPRFKAEGKAAAQVPQRWVQSLPSPAETLASCTPCQ
jgi:hypothetical protein